METLTNRADVDDPKTKEQIANQVLPLIEDVKGSVEREAYRQRLARLLRVDERSLVRRSTGYTPRYRRTYPPQTRISRPSPSQSDYSHRGLEEICIKALIFDPTLIHFVDRALRGYELACLYPDDFSHTDFKEIFRIVKQSLDQDQEAPIDFVHTRIPEELREALIEDQEDEAYPNWRHQPNAPILESLVNSFIRLRRIRIDEGLDQLVFLQSQDNIVEDEWSIVAMKIAMEFVQVRAKLDHALQQSSEGMKKLG
jgi:DNA primase